MRVKKLTSFSVLFLSWLVVSLSIVHAQATTYELSYDEVGNLQQSLGKYMEYNEFNQLVRVRDDDQNGAILEEYTYDQDGNRLTKYEPSINQTTHYISDDFIEVHNSTGKYLTVYYRDPQSGTLLGRKDPNGDKFYYHPDHLGSTSLVTDEAGNVVEETSYKPFGGVVSGGESRHLFAGKERDKNTGLDYLIARYYDSGTRFYTQADESILNVYDSRDLNRYSYARNNPYSYVDPTGEFIVPAIRFLVIPVTLGYLDGQAEFERQVAEFGQVIDPGKVALVGFSSGVGAIGGKGVGRASVRLAKALKLPSLSKGGIFALETSGSVAASQVTSNIAHGRSPAEGVEQAVQEETLEEAKRNAILQFVESADSTQSGVKSDVRLSLLERASIRSTTPRGSVDVLNRLVIQSFEGDRDALQQLYNSRRLAIVTKRPINLEAARKRIETKGSAF